MHPVYLGTVLLEKNRWTPDKRPSFAVSDWAARIAAAGFDGSCTIEFTAGVARPPEDLAALLAHAAADLQTLRTHL
jgi:hypothetical protein